MSVDTNYIHWKKVRKIIDEGKDTRNGIALRNYCFTQKEFEKMEKSTFSHYVYADKFNVGQKVVMWEHLKKFHPEKVEKILTEIELQSVELVQS